MNDFRFSGSIKGNASRRFTLAVRAVTEIEARIDVLRDVSHAFGVPVADVEIEYVMMHS